VARDGLPDLDIRGISRTSDGYLWIAGLNGLSRFDGARFTEIPESELKPNGATAVLTARDGTLWVGIARGGLARMRADRFQVEIPAPNKSDRFILSLAEDAGGAIWASFSEGGHILRWQKGRIDDFYFGDGDTPVSLCAATNGVLWFTSRKRCGFFNGREFQFLPQSDNGCASVAAARAGGVWTVCGQSLLRFQENGNVETVADLSWLGGATQVTALHEDREGNLWIASQGDGLIRFREGRFERVSTSFPLINCIYEDRSGNLWLGTHGGGLDRLHRRQIFMHAAPVDRSPTAGGPRDMRVGAVVVDATGRIWMAQGKSLVRATDATNRVFAPVPGLARPTGIYTLRSTPTDEIWMGGGSPRALRCWKDERFVAEVPLPGNLASFLLGDEPRQLWVALKPNPGIYEWRGKDLALIPESASIANPVALALDPQKRLWAGTLDGRVYFRNGKRFVEAPMPNPQPGDMVAFLVPDGRDTMWIGCLSGLYRWHAGRIDQLSPDSGLSTRDSRVLEIDLHGNFWLGTILGLFRIPRSELEALLDGRQSTLQAVAYGPDNGLPAAVGFAYGFLHSSARTRDGHLWFGTTFGGMEVVPADMDKAVAPPAVLLEEILARGKSLPLPKGSTPLVLSPQPGPIQIRYTLPELNSPEQVRFRYRLLGAGDDSWSSGDPQRAATFTNLPPGNYTFEVVAIDPLGATPPKAAALSFTVRAAWWQTLWFRLACALGGALTIALLVSALVKRRMQARIRRLEQEGALERERARIARDMHDDLGASITHIILMSELASAKTPSPDLERIAQKARTVSSTLDQIVWTTNPRNDTLGQLVGYLAEFAREYLANTGVSLRLELPAEVPARELSSEKRHHILLVVKEVLNNTVKHSGARHVHLHVDLQQDRLRIVIQDDGKGFHVTEVASTSNGLINMQHRMEAIGGKATITSEVSLGTTITLEAKV
jgi:signal transduction histidine kinase/ligand-binding sensor domain-containing protein